MLQARDVARKRFGVSQQEMREQNRLGVLHVGHARHRHAEICLGLLQDRAEKFGELPLEAGCGVHHEKAEIGGH